MIITLNRVRGSLAGRLRSEGDAFMTETVGRRRSVVGASPRALGRRWREKAPVPPGSRLPPAFRWLPVEAQPLLAGSGAVTLPRGWSRER